MSVFAFADDKPVNKRQFKVQTSITQEGDALSSPTVITQLGKEAIIRIVEERHLPESWELKEGVATPIFAEPTDFGVSQHVLINADEKVIHLSGLLKFRELIPNENLKKDTVDKNSQNVIFVDQLKTIRYAFNMTNRDKVDFEIKKNGKKITVKMTLIEVDKSGKALE
jgi:hypothetical protein